MHLHIFSHMYKPPYTQYMLFTLTVFHPAGFSYSHLLTRTSCIWCCSSIHNWRRQSLWPFSSGARPTLYWSTAARSSPKPLSPGVLSTLQPLRRRVPTWADQVHGRTRVWVNDSAMILTVAARQLNRTYKWAYRLCTLVPISSWLFIWAKAYSNIHLRQLMNHYWTVNV